MNYEKLQFESEIIDVVRFQYIFTDNHHKYIKQNAKVRVERSPIFKDRFFIVWKYFGKWCEAKCLMCNDLPIYYFF
jgi:hypothetical protein